MIKNAYVNTSNELIIQLNDGSTLNLKTKDEFEKLPNELRTQIKEEIYYGYFGICDYDDGFKNPFC